MPPPTDRGAYTREYEVMDRALASERGIIIGFTSEGEAKKFRERANKAKQLDRELNRRIYRDEPDHPMYGRSEYGILYTRVHFDADRGKWVCRLEKTKVEEMDIEDIPPPEIIEEEEDLTEEEEGDAEGAD